MIAVPIIDYRYRPHRIVFIIVLRQRRVTADAARIRSRRVYFNIGQHAAGYNGRKIVNLCTHVEIDKVPSYANFRPNCQLHRPSFSRHRFELPHWCTTRKRFEINQLFFTITYAIKTSSLYTFCDVEAHDIYLLFKVIHSIQVYLDRINFIIS